jgi:uncharacterized protein (DUF1330 family)
MSAFLVIDMTIHDLKAFSAYIRGVPAFIEKHSGKYIVQGAEPTVMEGDWEPERLIIIKFPARAQAKAFLEDPEFQDLVAIRHKSTTSKVVLVDGC